ncbi:MAG: major capsid protein [Candidatus Competibacteraceae bacterium]|nr:major capsid protein [Candidatus Competibacteraceae bacterium]
MAQPTISSVHVDAVLSNISVAYMQDEINFIAGRVFPTVPVGKKTDVYFTFDKNDLLRDEMQRRAPGDESAGSGYGLSTASYSCDVFALHKDIDDDTRANSDNPLNPDRDATMFLTQQALLKREIQWVTDYFTINVWGTDVVGGSDFTVWSNYAGSDPISDVDTGITTVMQNTGRRPNTMVLGYETFTKLKRHPDIVDLFKNTQPGLVSAQILAQIWDLDNVYVAQAVKATNIEDETAAYSFVHGKHAWVGYVNNNPGLLAPSAGYVFNWTGVSGGLGLESAISRFRIDERKSDRIEIEMAWDNKVVGSDLGYFFSGATA